MPGAILSVLAILRVLRVGITVVMEALGAFRPVKLMALAGTKTESNQDRK